MSCGSGVQVQLEMFEGLAILSSAQPISACHGGDAYVSEVDTASKPPDALPAAEVAATPAAAAAPALEAAPPAVPAAPAAEPAPKAAAGFAAAEPGEGTQDGAREEGLAEQSAEGEPGERGGTAGQSKESREEEEAKEGAEEAQFGHKLPLHKLPSARMRARAAEPAAGAKLLQGGVEAARNCIALGVAKVRERLSGSRAEHKEPQPKRRSKPPALSPLREPRVFSIAKKTLGQSPAQAAAQQAAAERPSRSAAAAQQSPAQPSAERASRSAAAAQQPPPPPSHVLPRGARSSELEILLQSAAEGRNLARAEGEQNRTRSAGRTTRTSASEPADKAPRAAAASSEPDDKGQRYVGQVVYKNFTGFGVFKGKVISVHVFDTGLGFRVRYSDGDEEDIVRARARVPAPCAPPSPCAMFLCRARWLTRPLRCPTLSAPRPARRPQDEEELKRLMSAGKSG